ncbi:MAG: DUF6364 family protein [Chthoniobacterales bacterium]
MKLVVNIDKQIVARASAIARARGKSLDELIADYLGGLADIERDMEEFRELSGRGDSRGSKFNRDEIHERR